ncbi:MAG: hypothetical protein JOZ38_12390 [Candidatus Eremiobacteraeota bacterium]|nr:hypothetical protein [Candidatus Eremiobacteraeota bacterium]
MTKRALAAGAAACAVALVVSHFRSTAYNNYVLLANAWLHGRAWIDWPGQYIDALLYHGRYYVIEAPMPAVLLLPWVAAAGVHANQTLLAVVLCGVAVGAAWSIGERLGVRPRDLALLCAFLLAGTDLLWCAMLGDVWFVAHVSAACFTFLALAELVHGRRGWLVALWGACAAASRFSLVLALPVYAALLWSGVPRFRRYAGFCAVVLCAVALSIWYNEVRWGTALDIGYTTWFHQDAAGAPSGSPFRLSYLPYELWSFFVQVPSFAAIAPFVVPSFSGVALTWTSPALLLALWARRPQPLVASMWVAAFLTAAPSFLYYVNGFAQFGMRHALDFEPFLFVLMLAAAQPGLATIWRVLVGWSVSVGAWGCWYWNVFVRPGY